LSLNISSILSFVFPIFPLPFPLSLFPLSFPLSFQYFLYLFLCHSNISSIFSFVIPIFPLSFPLSFQYFLYPFLCPSNISPLLSFVMCATCIIETDDVASFAAVLPHRAPIGHAGGRRRRLRESGKAGQRLADRRRHANFHASCGGGRRIGISWCGLRSSGGGRRLARLQKDGTVDMAGGLRLGPVVLHDVREIFLKSSAGHLDNFIIKKRRTFFVGKTVTSRLLSTMDPIPNEGCRIPVNRTFELRWTRYR